AARGIEIRRISQAYPRRGRSEEKSGRVGDFHNARSRTAAITTLWPTTAHAAPATPRPAVKMTSGETASVMAPATAPAAAGWAALPPPRRTLAAALNSQNG